MAVHLERSSNESLLKRMENTKHQSINQALVLSVFLYACETWILTAELQRKTRQWKWYVLEEHSASHTHRTRHKSDNTCNHNQAHEMLCRADDHRHNKKTVMVWPRDKSQWPIRDRPPRCSSRWKKEGKTEKEMDLQHCRVDRKELCYDPNPCPWS